MHVCPEQAAREPREHAWGAGQGPRETSPGQRWPRGKHKPAEAGAMHLREPGRRTDQPAGKPGRQAGGEPPPTRAEAQPKCQGDPKGRGA